MRCFLDNIEQMNICVVLNDKAVPGLEMVQKLADHFGGDVREMFRGK